MLLVVFLVKRNKKYQNKFNMCVNRSKRHYFFWTAINRFSIRRHFLSVTCRCFLWIICCVDRPLPQSFCIRLRLNNISLHYKNAPSKVLEDQSYTNNKPRRQAGRVNDGVERLRQVRLIIKHG